MTTINTSSVEVNPAVTAMSLPASDTNDEYSRDSDGNPLGPTDITQREEQANRLGISTGASVLAESARKVFNHLASRAKKLAYLADIEQVRGSDEEEYVELRTQQQDLAYYCGTAGYNATRKRLSLWSKPGFVIGDMMVFASVIKRDSGSGGVGNNLVAYLVGVSLATTAVAVGTKFGRELALAHERRKRGPAPKGAPSHVLRFFATGDSDDEGRIWRNLAVVAALVLLFAVALISKSAGDSAATALGYGLLATLTFAGSAAAEAYGTDEPGEAYVSLTPSIAAKETKLDGFATIAGGAAADLMAAKGEEIAGAWESQSAMGTVSEIANDHRNNLVMKGLISNDVAVPLTPLPDAKTVEIPIDLPAAAQPDAPAPRAVRSILRHRATDPSEESGGVEDADTPDMLDHSVPVVTLTDTGASNNSHSNGKKVEA